MNSVSLLREQLQSAHWLLEETTKDITPEQVHWSPPGKANPLGATYAHLVLSEDALVNGMFRGSAPLFADNWAGKVGISEPPPQDPNQSWDQWARRVRIDLGALRQYSQAVYANSDQFLASLSDDALSRPMDFSSVGLGQQTLAWALTNTVIGHARDHCGEIACLKGLQGARGYPF